MPKAPKKPCAQIGCSALVDRGYCADHQKARPPAGNVRINPYRHMYNRRWERERRIYLQLNALCVYCEGRGILMPATEVDHIHAHKGDIKLFWDTGNWQALCKSCHSRKTATHDGAFNRG